MSVPAAYIDPLLEAAHAFLDAPDHGTLLKTIELHTTSILGGLKARVLEVRGRSQLNQEMAAQLRLTESLQIHPDEELRRRLEPFYALTKAICDHDANEAAQAARELFGEHAFCCAPMHAGNQFYGVLAVLDELGVRRFNDEDRALMMELARFAAQALRAEQITSDREARDGLTGLFDQAYLRRELQVELQRALRRGEPLTLLMLDIDHFKKINDTAGHAAGDAVLRRVAAFLREDRRQSDVVVRYGGEEFAVLLVGADLESGRQTAEAIRQAISTLAPEEWTPWHGQVTLSCGVASFRSRWEELDHAAAVIRWLAEQARVRHLTLSQQQIAQLAASAAGTLNQHKEAIINLPAPQAQADTQLKITRSDLVSIYANELIERADRALYEAKRKGRNRVCLAAGSS